MTTSSRRPRAEHSTTYLLRGRLAVDVAEIMTRTVIARESGFTLLTDEEKLPFDYPYMLHLGELCPWCITQAT